MKSTPQDHPPSYEASPKSSQHPASCNYTPSTAQEDRGAGMNHDLERVHSWPSASLARTSKDTVPRQLPDTPFSVSIDSDESTPEEAQRIYLKVLSSGLSALTLNPEPSLSSNSRAIVDEGLLYPLIETDSSTTCAGHNAPPFKPHQFGNSNRPAGISTAENDSQPPSSKTDAANRTGATTRTRRKPNASDDQQEEEEDDTSDGDDRAPPNARKAMSSSKRPMACPYRKRDAKRFSFHTHPKCTEGFANITAVKQHVKKKHMLSDSELASQDHQNFENGITPDFERILAARKPTRVNTWEKLWIVLFNEETDIPSPDHEPCHILESSEAAELMKQLDATDDAINHVMSTYLTSRDPEANMTESRKRKRHGKQKAELINTSGQTNVSKGAISQPNRTLRKLAPRTAASHTPGHLGAPSSGQETGPLTSDTVRDISPLDLAAHGAASDTIGSPAGPVRRSARLTPQMAQTPLTASFYPPVHESELWNADDHDAQHFPDYIQEFEWMPGHDQIREDPHEDD